MKVTILLFSLLFLFSCELHEQTNLTGKKADAKVINLSVIEKISSAIVQNDYKLVEEILSEGEFEVNIPDKSGELILNKAIKSNRFVIGSFLLKNGASPKAEDEQGHTGITLAENSANAADWKNLFEGVKLTSTTASTQIFSLLEGASSANEAKFAPLIKGLIELGAPFDGANEGMFTYLMVSSSKNLIAIVGLFCQYPEIDPNVVVERGRGRRKKTFTALSLATTTEMKELLKKCGATE